MYGEKLTMFNSFEVRDFLAQLGDKMVSNKKKSSKKKKRDFLSKPTIRRSGQRRRRTGIYGAWNLRALHRKNGLREKRLQLIEMS